MVYTVKSFWKESEKSDYQIVSERGKMGIFYPKIRRRIVPLSYDNILPCGKNLFIVYQCGKIGAFRLQEHRVCWVAECVYDTLDANAEHLFFSNANSIRYYHTLFKTVWDFTELATDEEFIYAKDKQFLYIIAMDSGKVIYQKKYADYNSSCFFFLGYGEMGPVFYDAGYSSFLYPDKQGYREYQDLFDYPIRINHVNVCNVTKGEGGFGLIDSSGNQILPNQYDILNAELKITAMNQEETMEKIITIPENAFQEWLLCHGENT